MDFHLDLLIIFWSCFLFCHPVQCRSNDLPRCTALSWYYSSYHTLTFSILFAFSFLSLSIHPVNNSCSRHDIGNTTTYETTSIIKNT